MATRTRKHFMGQGVVTLLLLFLSFVSMGQTTPAQIQKAPGAGYVLYSRDSVIGGVNHVGRYFHWRADSVFQDRALDRAYLSNDSLYLVVVNDVTGVADTLSVRLPYMDSTDISATMPITYNPLTGNISTSVNEGHLVGRFSVGGAGVMQEIDIGYGLDLTTTGVLRADTSELVTVTALIDSIANIPAQTITLSGDVGGTGTTAITTTIANNAVSNAKFRTSAGLSVVGRSANTTGNVADITASTDGHVLRRSGTSIGFGLVPLSSISATNNQVVFGSGGVQSQNSGFIYDGTNVGIGNNPVRDLDVIRTSAGFPSIRLLNNGTGAARLELTAQPGGNDAFAAFGVSGIQNYSFGIDNSDSDKFKITTGASPSAGTIILAGTSTGQVGIGTDNPTSQLDVNGDIETTSSSAFYLGDPTTDGTWRIIRSGNDLLSQRREAGVYVTKQTITP